MNIVLWIIQVLLAVMFAIHGRIMLPASPTIPQPGMNYILAIPLPFRRFIGVAEILAAVGLILPGLTGVLPVLTPLAAVGLVIVMIGAIIMHIPRKEYANIVLNIVLLVLAALVAYGRFVLAPF
jgi:uncharacterized membrane protein YphA (DoxX/SURF4 family)